ncbi:MAG: hypothetical protein GY849_02090 [Deltaproteobacteria bacterium]|nr:hypothetical protein [Deltaproteobacteria bacterium]
MKLTEGNLIQHNFLGIVIFVAKIGVDIYYKGLKSNKIYDGHCIENEFNSIKLTKKWLLDFIFNFDNGHYVKSGLFIGIRNNEFVIPLENTKFNNRILTLNYVHELQNFYYSLFKEELTLKKT